MASDRVDDPAALLARAEAGDADAARALYAAAPDWAAQPEPARFRLECGQLRYMLDHPDDFDDERARELYSGLLDRHAADAPRLAEVRGLGAALHALEQAGRVPRAMVVRGRRDRPR